MIFGVDAFYECVLWSYWGECKPLDISARFPLPPLEGDDITVDGKVYSVMARRIAHGEPLRLYVSLDCDDSDAHVAGEAAE